MRTFLSIPLVALALVACGGGNSDNPPVEEALPVGIVSLGITDAPVDSALAVNIEFTGVALKPANGDEMVFNYESPVTVNLLDYQGDAAFPLITNENMAAGEYNWVRLMIDAEGGSNIVISDGSTHSLRIPSGAQTGLKLVSGFTVATGQTHNFTIDFDLAKSVTNPPGQGQYLLKPALRLVNNLEVGTIAGSVDSELIAASCDDPSTNNGAVYVYSDADVTPFEYSADAAPLTAVLLDAEGLFTVGFMMAGSYTLAYTCDNVADDPELVDNVEGETPLVVFDAAANVDVVAGDTADVTLGAESP